MNALDAMREVLNRENLSVTDVSVKMGYNRTNLTSTFSRENEPKPSKIVRFAEATGYELIMRSKSDGFEFIIDE
ncbi:MAG: hypothetical protein IKF14_13205 [Atopobiaceae bacterium]|nr:hypothetical protein [Atopobiaceae bacterium]